MVTDYDACTAPAVIYIQQNEHLGSPHMIIEKIYASCDESGLNLVQCVESYYA